MQAETSHTTGSGALAFWGRWAPYLQSILRIITALLFMQFGGMKLFGFPMPMPEGMTTPLFSQVWFASVLELYGGALVALGLFTRPVAFLLSGMMAVAYFQSHASGGFWPAVNGGGDAVLYCFIWLFFSAAGAGPWSIDALLAKRRGR